jgi:uncharacterized BrkB/YihY/UPF0761 family membrane protein
MVLKHQQSAFKDSFDRSVDCQSRRTIVSIKITNLYWNLLTAQLLLLISLSSVKGPHTTLPFATISDHFARYHSKIIQLVEK